MLDRLFNTALLLAIVLWTLLWTHSLLLRAPGPAAAQARVAAAAVVELPRVVVSAPRAAAPSGGTSVPGDVLRLVAN